MEMSNVIPDKFLYRPDEAAKFLGVHVLTIYRWVREGKIISIKTRGGHNRIPKSEIYSKNISKP